MAAIRKIGVLGAGTMGHGIAEVSALFGYEVVMIDVSQEILDSARKRIRDSLAKLVGKDRAEEVLKRVKLSTDYSDLRDVDLVIEAVPERFELKVQVFKEVEKYVKADTILGTNTSTIPINELAAATSRKDKFIGIHFMNPPVLMPLVEVILGNETSQDTLDKVIEYVKSIRKEYVIVRKDVPGFLVNRINARTFLEALLMFEEGLSKEDIDSMARFRLGLPMGFMELADFVGIDVLYYALNEMIRRGEKLVIPRILEVMVKEGRLGAKSGAGFYEHPGKTFRRPHLVPREGMYRVNPGRIVAVAANEAANLIGNGIASREDIEKAMTLGMNWPHGPLYLADHYGLNNLLRVLESRYNETKYEVYTVSPYLRQLVSGGNIGAKGGKGFFEYVYAREDAGPVSYEKVENYAIITIRRPERLNALNEEVWRGLRVFLEKAEADRDVRSVVLTGEGNAFSAGDDIEMMKAWTNSSVAKRWLEELAWPLVNKTLNYTKPIIAAVRGYAFGGGMELVLLADIVVAAESSVFAIPEALIGAFPPAATPLGVYLTDRRIVRYALTGDWLSAEEAKSLGVVDIVVPDDQLDIAVFEVVDKISRASPLSIRAVKRALNSSKSIYLNPLLNALNELVILADSKDFAEGMKAFLEKRRPSFRGE